MNCQKIIGGKYRGYHCPKQAKKRVWFGDGPVVCYCGTHVNQALRKGAMAADLPGSEVEK